MKTNQIARSFSFIAAAIVVLGALGLALVSQVRTSNAVIGKGLEVWESELAKSVADNRWLTVDRILRSFEPQGIHSIQVYKDQRLVFSHPAVSAVSVCRMSLQRDISHYGVTIGTTRFCRIPTYFVLAAVTSPIFLFTMFGVLTLGFALKGISLRGYRTSVLETIETLETWAAQRSIESGHRATGSDQTDPLANRLMDLVATGTRARIEAAQMKAELLISESRAQLAAQVAHDIRSPLVALSVVLPSLEKIPDEERRIVRSAVDRIRDIAENLLKETREDRKLGLPISEQKRCSDRDSQDLSVEQLSSVVDDVVNEKRVILREGSSLQLNVRLDQGYGLFCRMDSGDFKRVLSNLLNNAMEATDSSRGIVQISISKRDQFAQVLIEDNGKGIPEEVLPKLFARGFSHGKGNGNGLGLHHAKTTLESWGGSLELTSRVGQGARVVMRIPVAQSPAWFVPELELGEGRSVVVVDDDRTIHDLWRLRFSQWKHDLKAIHFSEAAEFSKWMRANLHRDDLLFLVDHELRNWAQTGLDLIETYGLSTQSVLVTSCSGDPDVRTRCERLGVSMIPKSLVDMVPLRS